MLIVEFFKMITIHLCVYLLFSKIVAYKERTIKSTIIMFISIIGITCIYLLLQHLNVSFSARLLITGLLYSVLLSNITNNLINTSIIMVVISYAIALITYTFVGIILYFIIGKHYDSASNARYIIDVLICDCLTILMLYIFLKVKKFENGFSFIDKTNKLEVLNVAFIVISLEVILYFIILRKPIDELKDEDIFSFFVITGIFMGILVFICFRAYYKSIQTQKMIENFKSELKAKNEEYNKLFKEHERVTKKLHETSHKVKALSYYVNMEHVEENEDLIQEIENLKEKLSTSSAIDKENSLPKTNVFSIDMMFNYMKSEAKRNNIEFELNISENINYMVDNIVDKQDLEIMIADHIKDGIIAIKSKEDKKERKILVKLGEFNKYYELSISDTGIDFEIDTLINLGLKRITTHADTGGTGIGFMTTFETLKKYRASLIIEEKQASDVYYTKAVIIRFDGKNEYKIRTYRYQEIALQKKDDRVIIEST